MVAKHGGNMVKTMLCDGSFACFDMLMCTIPAVVLSVISLLLNGVMFVVGVTIARKQLDIFFASVIMSAVNSYLVMLLMGLLPLVTEWRRIRCSRGKKIGYLFTFPFFVFTFGIAMVLAVFGNIEWKPIKHSVAPVSYTHLDVYKRQISGLVGRSEGPSSPKPAFWQLYHFTPTAAQKSICSLAMRMASSTSKVKWPYRFTRSTPHSLVRSTRAWGSSA